MGQRQSKDELLYQHAINGDIGAIKGLCAEEAGLEWVDREGKTPLIVACMNPDLYNVAKTLLELGADINAYGPGRNGGTPLHHAARKGLEKTVKLLLSYRANALIINDACQSPLDIARAAGHKNVVRAIENHICLFSGWMREFYGPELFEVLVPQLLSRKVWAVILPCSSRNPTKPLRLELVLYPNMEDPQPRAVVPLWRSNLEEHKLQEADPSIVIVDNSPIMRGRRRRRSSYTSWQARCRFQKTRSRLRLAPAIDEDRQQLQWFCDACKGIPQPKPMHTPVSYNYQTPIDLATVSPSVEDLELEMAINASIESAMLETPQLLNPPSTSKFEAGASSSSSSNLVAPSSPNNPNANQWTVLEAAETPSAPPVGTEFFEANSCPTPPVEIIDKKEGNNVNSSCVICLDASVEGACVPCGHMAGCMACLNEIKAKNWGCPVCRTKVTQVIKLYVV